MTRATYLLLTDFERIEEWCQKVRRIFAGVGHVGVFLVGSALTRADYRDIDLRLMLTDETWDTGRWSDPVRTRYVNAMFSTWGQRETGLPIDFQVQRMGTANASFGDKPRDPMGVRDWERATPSGGTFDDPDTRVDEMCRCGRKAYRPQPMGVRRSAIRCSGCHLMRGNCKCARLSEDLLREVFEFWQGRPDLAPGAALLDRVYRATATPPNTAEDER